MRRVLPLVVLTALASSAAADGFYFTEQIGATKVHDQLGASMPDTSLRVRVSLGLRRDRWSLSGYIGGDIGNSLSTGADDPVFDTYSSGPATLTSYGLDLKYVSPVTRHIEFYLRGSAGGGSLTGAGLDGYGGRSLGVGAGVQLKGKVPIIGLLWFPLFFTNWGPKMTASLYVDSGYEFYRFHRDDDPSIDAQVSHVTVGWSFGSDF